MLPGAIELRTCYGGSTPTHAARTLHLSSARMRMHMREARTRKPERSERVRTRMFRCVSNISSSRPSVQQCSQVTIHQLTGCFSSSCVDMYRISIAIFWYIWWAGETAGTGFKVHIGNHLAKSHREIWWRKWLRGGWVALTATASPLSTSADLTFRPSDPLDLNWFSPHHWCHSGHQMGVCVCVCV